VNQQETLTPTLSRSRGEMHGYAAVSSVVAAAQRVND